MDTCCVHRKEPRRLVSGLEIVDVSPGEKREISKPAYGRKVLSSGKPCYDEDDVDFPKEHTS